MQQAGAVGLERSSVSAGHRIGTVGIENIVVARPALGKLAPSSDVAAAREIHGLAWQPAIQHPPHERAASRSVPELSAACCCVSHTCSNCAATAAAITGRRLALRCRAGRSDRPCWPCARRRSRARAAGVRTAGAWFSSRSGRTSRHRRARRMCSASCWSSAWLCVMTRKLEPGRGGVDQRFRRIGGFDPHIGRQLRREHVFALVDPGHAAGQCGQRAHDRGADVAGAEQEQVRARRQARIDQPAAAVRRRAARGTAAADRKRARRVPLGRTAACRRARTAEAPAAHRARSGASCPAVRAGAAADSR